MTLTFVYRTYIEVMSTIASQSPLNISETAKARLDLKGPSIGNGLQRVVIRLSRKQLQMLFTNVAAVKQCGRLS